MELMMHRPHCTSSLFCLQEENPSCNQGCVWAPEKYCFSFLYRKLTLGPCSLLSGMERSIHVAIQSLQRSKTPFGYFLLNLGLQYWKKCQDTEGCY